MFIDLHLLLKETWGKYTFDNHLIYHHQLEIGTGHSMFYMLIFKRHKNEFAFSVIWHSHVTGRQKPFSRKTMTHVPYIANTTANDCINNHGTCFDIPEYSGLDTSTFYRWQRPDDSRTETMHLEVPWNKYMLTMRKAPFMGKACIYTKIILFNRVSKVMFWLWAGIAMAMQWHLCYEDGDVLP